MDYGKNINDYTPEYIKNLNNYTDNFLCSTKDNLYNIRFIQFTVRDLDSNYTLFEVFEEENFDEDLENTEYPMKYHLGPDFLDFNNIGTITKFSVGNQPVRNLLVIERHYFRKKLVKSFEFKFDFCIPNSINNWETIYNIPELDNDIKQDMINNPWETKSDSFYFVENKLIMHHKAEYNYSSLD